MIGRSYSRSTGRNCNSANSIIGCRGDASCLRRDTLNSKPACASIKAMEQQQVRLQRKTREQRPDGAGEREIRGKCGGRAPMFVLDLRQ